MESSGTSFSLSQFEEGPRPPGDVTSVGSSLAINPRDFFSSHRHVLPLRPSSNAPIVPTELRWWHCFESESPSYQKPSIKHNCLAAWTLSRLLEAKGSWCEHRVYDSELLWLKLKIQTWLVQLLVYFSLAALCSIFIQEGEWWAGRTSGVGQRKLYMNTCALWRLDTTYLCAPTDTRTHINKTPN